MIEYFLVAFVFNHKRYWCIWFTGEIDGFLLEAKALKYFNSIELLYSYAKNINIDINEKQTIISIDKIIEWLEIDNKKIDCVYFLNFWNMITDLAKSVDEIFYGDSDKDIVNEIYNKLFYGNNVHAIYDVEEKHEPVWVNDEVSELIKIVEDGIRIIKKVFI